MVCFMGEGVEFVVDFGEVVGDVFGVVVEEFVVFFV